MDINGRFTEDELIECISNNLKLQAIATVVNSNEYDDGVKVRVIRDFIKEVK